MNTLVVLVAVVAAVAAAPQKEASKPFAFNSGLLPSNQAFYPGQPAYLGYPGYNGYQGYRAGAYYPGYQGYQGYYPGYQGYPGYSGYHGYSGYQGYYPGYQGYNRGYYQGAAPAVSVFPSSTPAPIIAPVPVAPKIAVSPVYKAVDNKLPAIVRQSQEVNFDGNFKYGYETENGIVAQAAGYVKNVGTEGAAQVIEGSYAYVGDDGAPVEVKYYADETGYHAVGNVVPTTPPEIARSLELIASQPQKPEDSKKK